MPTLYDSLKVTPDAPADVIRAAYRALAALYHPDRQSGEAASHEEMAAINAAYAVLGDAEQRAQYDAQLVATGLGPWVPVATQAARPTYAPPPEITVPPERDLDSLLQDSLLDDSPAPEPATPRRARPEASWRDFSPSRVDVEWRDGSPVPQAPRRRTRRLEIWGLSLSILAATGAALWISHEQVARAEAEVALSANWQRGGSHFGLRAAGNEVAQGRSMFAVLDWAASGPDLRAAAAQTAPRLAIAGEVLGPEGPAPTTVHPALVAHEDPFTLIETAPTSAGPLLMSADAAAAAASAASASAASGDAIPAPGPGDLADADAGTPGPAGVGPAPLQAAEGGVLRRN